MSKQYCNAESYGDDGKVFLAKDDAEFRKNIGLAMGLLELLPSRHDRMKAMFWVKKLSQIDSDIPYVKRGRNEFLDYFLNILRDAVYTAALSTTKGSSLSPKARLKLKEEIRHFGKPNVQTYIIDAILRTREGAEYMCRWSKDKRTYVGMQPIAGVGALIYMAVTDSPDDGWYIPQR